MRKYDLVLFTIIMMCALVLTADAHIQDQEHIKCRLNDSDIHNDVYQRRPKKMLQTHNLFLEKMSDSEVTITLMEMESLGWYYITAYCPYECGYNGENFPAGWRTASDTICHRADWEDRYTEPTTCAVDPRLHSIWGDEFFYIEEFDRVFVAEDTGSAVKGKHLDLFYDDESVEGFPTGYYEVFAVEYYEETILLGG